MFFDIPPGIFANRLFCTDISSVGSSASKMISSTRADMRNFLSSVISDVSTRRIYIRVACLQLPYRGRAGTSSARPHGREVRDRVNTQEEVGGPRNAVHGSFYGFRSVGTSARRSHLQSPCATNRRPRSSSSLQFVLSRCSRDGLPLPVGDLFRTVL